MAMQGGWTTLWLLTLCCVLTAAIGEDGADTVAELPVSLEAGGMGEDFPPLAPKQGVVREEEEDEDDGEEFQELEQHDDNDDPDLPELSEAEEMTVGERADMGMLSTDDTMSQGTKLLKMLKDAIADPSKMLKLMKNASATGFKGDKKPLDDIDGVKPVSIFSLGGAMKDSPVTKMLKDKMGQLGTFAGSLIDDSPFRGLKDGAKSIEKKLTDKKSKKVAETFNSPEKVSTHLNRSDL